MKQAQQSLNRTKLCCILAVLLADTPSTCAFSPGSMASVSTRPLRNTAVRPTRPVDQSPHHMTLSDVNDFYQQFPLQSAILTCGFKASVADCIAQLRVHSDTVEFRRNLAYVIYGGIFVGGMCHLEYDYVFPYLFGNEHSIVTTIEEVVFDNFVSAPLMWLPPAYMIKALVYDYPISEGLEKYINDIRFNGLMQKYLAIWIPAQSISFSVVPEHLRVAFMACVSFFWFILFSTVSSKEVEDEVGSAA